MDEKSQNSKTITKSGIVSYITKLCEEIEEAYKNYDRSKTMLLSLTSYRDLLQEKLIKIMSLWEEINEDIQEEEDFQGELEKSLDFEAKIKFEIIRLEKFIAEKSNSFTTTNNSEKISSSLVLNQQDPNVRAQCAPRVE